MKKESNLSPKFLIKWKSCPKIFFFHLILLFLRSRRCWKENNKPESFFIILETQFSIWRTILYKHRRSSQFTSEKDSDSSKWIIERIFGKLSRHTTVLNRIVLLCKWSFPDSELVELFGSWWIDGRWRVCNLLRISGFSLKFIQSCAVINRLKLKFQQKYQTGNPSKATSTPGSPKMTWNYETEWTLSKPESRCFVVEVCKLKLR